MFECKFFFTHFFCMSTASNFFYLRILTKLQNKLIMSDDEFGVVGHTAQGAAIGAAGS